MLDARTKWTVLPQLVLAVTVWSAVVLAQTSPAQEEPAVRVVSQTGHSTRIASVAFSPDGHTAVSGSDDSTVKLWDVATGKLLCTFEGHSSFVNSVAFSPDGRTVLSGSDDKTLKLWDLATGRPPRTFAGHSESVTSVAFSPDGRTALSGSGDKTLKLWDVATGKLLRNFRGRSEAITSVAFSPDGRAALSGSDDKTLKLWDVATGRLLRTFAGHSESVTSVAFSPDGRIALSGSADNTLKLWDVTTRKLLRTFEGHSLPVSSVVFSPDGHTAVSAGDNGSFALWDMNTGKLLHTFTGHSSFVDSVVFAPDGGTVMSGGSDNTLKLWDVATGRLLRTYKGHADRIFSATFSPDGLTALSGGQDQTLKLWDLATGKLLRTFEGHFDRILSVAFSPDGRTALSGSNDRTSKLWDVASGKLLRTFEGHSLAVISVAFSPDGRTALSGSGDKTLKLWDVATGKLLRTFEGHSEAVLSVAFSLNGQSVISGGDFGSIYLWDVATGKLLRSSGHSYIVTSVAFSPDGRIALSGGYENTVNNNSLKLWDVVTGQLLRTFEEGHFSFVTSVAFSPDGQSVLSGDGYDSLKLWDVATGKLLRTFEGYSGSVDTVAFAPDGRTVLAGGEDAFLRVWSTSSGHELLRTMASGDGDWLATTPAGFFDFGGDIEEMVHLVRGSDVISIRQVFETLYRPDLIQELLKGDLEGKHKDAAYHLKLDVLLGSGPPPQLEHLPERDDRAGDSVRLTIRLSGTGGGIGRRIVWKVNGVTQGDTNPPSLANAEGPLGSVVVTELLKMVPGQSNVVEVTAYNQKGLLATPPLKITVDAFGTTTGERPRMFVLSLGVNNYRMKEYQLAYAVNDARAFTNALSIVGSGLFSKVIATTLTDEQVSEAGIATAIDKIAAEARADDVFVLFLGGHGKSIAGRYYYYPQTLDFVAQQRVEDHGIGQDKWEAWLARIPVQKSLLVIDTCEGDAYQGPRGTDDTVRQTAMAQLQHATGRNIIAASRNAAYEGFEGHGVLTYAILEALDKKDTADGDDRVGVAALADYIGVRVPEISQSRFGLLQNPTRKLAGNDFPIGIRQSVLGFGSGSGPEIPK